MEELNSTLRPLLQEVLEQLVDDCTVSNLTADNCKQLINDRPSSCDQYHSQVDTGESDKTHLLTGYPSYPLYTRLSEALSYWMLTGWAAHVLCKSCPQCTFSTNYPAKNKVAGLKGQRIISATPKLTRAYALWNDWSKDERLYFLSEIITMLGLRGILDLLGLRQTVGSADILPPSRETLLTSFCALHCSPAKLTVGARALSKHHHRDDTAHWWGNCTGTDSAKNEHALKIVTKIIDNALWINIHALPVKPKHDVKVIEMRTTEGYGARWLYDGSEFRGFLEPQMEDGHEARWRH